MPVVVLPRWAGALAAAASLTVAGLATVSAETVPAAAATSHVTASGPSVSPRFVKAHHAASLPSGFTQVCPQPASPGVMRCSIVVHSQISVQPANKPASGSLSPGQLRSAYGLSQAAQASNKDTIAIVDAYNDWHATGDLAKYRSYYGLGACKESTKCLRVVNQKGTTAWYPKGNSGWAEEESLDLDMVSAICPKCKILLVESNATTAGSLSAAEATAVRLGAKFISNSWGGAEFSTETSYDSAFEHPGVAVTVAAGDYGYADGSQWPAVNPDVTAVGGTTLWMKGKTRTEEKVWNLGAFDGTGSGCSAGLETQQAWQNQYGAGNCGYRIDNDVAADADPRTGPAVYDSYAPSGSGLPNGWQQLGGTSAATPIIAAAYALANPGGAPASASLPTQFPYLATSGLRDITIGSNGSCSGTYLCTAETGYDGPTGLGVPSGVNAFK
jgi:subtilase family serine protease